MSLGHFNQDSDNNKNDAIINKYNLNENNKHKKLMYEIFIYFFYYENYLSEYKIKYFSSKKYCYLIKLQSINELKQRYKYQKLSEKLKQFSKANNNINYNNLDNYINKIIDKFINTNIIDNENSHFSLGSIEPNSASFILDSKIMKIIKNNRFIKSEKINEFEILKIDDNNNNMILHHKDYIITVGVVKNLVFDPKYIFEYNSMGKFVEEKNLLLLNPINQYINCRGCNENSLEKQILKNNKNEILGQLSLISNQKIKTKINLVNNNITCENNSPQINHFQDSNRNNYSSEKKKNFNKKVKIKDPNMIYNNNPRRNNAKNTKEYNSPEIKNLQNKKYFSNKIKNKHQSKIAPTNNIENYNNKDNNKDNNIINYHQLKSPQMQKNKNFINNVKKKNFTEQNNGPMNEKNLNKNFENHIQKDNLEFNNKNNKIGKGNNIKQKEINEEQKINNIEQNKKGKNEHLHKNNKELNYKIISKKIHQRNISLNDDKNLLFNNTFKNSPGKIIKKIKSNYNIKTDNNLNHNNMNIINMNNNNMNNKNMNHHELIHNDMNHNNMNNKIMLPNDINNNKIINNNIKHYNMNNNIKLNNIKHNNIMEHNNNINNKNMTYNNINNNDIKQNNNNIKHNKDINPNNLKHNNIKPNKDINHNNIKDNNDIKHNKDINLNNNINHNHINHNNDINLNNNINHNNIAHNNIILNQNNNINHNNIDFNNMNNHINNNNNQILLNPKKLKQEQDNLNDKFKQEQDNLNKKLKKEPLILYNSPTLIGLNNIGATCFMNATLQCLSQTAPLTNYFLNTENKNKIMNNNISIKNKNECQLSPVYYELVHKLWDLNGPKSFSPYNFMNMINSMNPLFKKGEPGDSKDFIIFILEQLHKELKKPVKFFKNDLNPQPPLNQYDKVNAFNYFFKEFQKETSIISDIFFGFTETTNECQYCKFNCISQGKANPICYNYQIFNCLIFPLEEVKKMRNNFYQVNTNFVTLEECFVYYQQNELFTGQNRNYCNLCKQLSNALYSTKIFVAPEILVLILNRGKGNIFDVKLIFYEYIDITKFILQRELTKISYNLYGVITHIGKSGPSAHFIASCKSPINDKWYRYNDAIVTPIENIQKDIIDFGVPYILFYKKNK